MPDNATRACLIQQSAMPMDKQVQWALTSRCAGKIGEVRIACHCISTSSLYLMAFIHLDNDDVDYAHYRISSNTK